MKLLFKDFINIFKELPNAIKIEFNSIRNYFKKVFAEYIRYLYGVV